MPCSARPATKGAARRCGTLTEGREGSPAMKKTAAAGSRPQGESPDGAGSYTAASRGRSPGSRREKSIRPGTLDRLPADRPKVSSSPQPTGRGGRRFRGKEPGWRASEASGEGVTPRSASSPRDSRRGALAGNALAGETDTRRDYRDHCSHAERPRKVDNAPTRLDASSREAPGCDCNLRFPDVLRNASVASAVAVRRLARDAARARCP